ncbi:MAG TPA: AIR synthase-related protein, partial [Bdellovibrionales bacterium]|nr:AIR synthase-related protein [Bdellovibrionales bacterium]
VGPEEILLSESQERMLLVCTPANFEKVKAVFHRWGLDAAILGEVTKGPEVELYWKKDSLCKIDPKLLTDHAPMYERPYEKWTPKNKTEALNAQGIDVPGALASVEGTSRRWIYQQYDQRVGAKTVRDCEDSVAVVRLPDSGRGMGLVLGCRPALMRVDARLGGYDAAFYPALELSAKGFEPLAMTDCLNFANPEKPEIMSEFVAAVEALAHASRVMDAPVISGNVSFYNETLNRGITSTPATGVVGLRPTIDNIPRSYFTGEGQDIYLWRLPGVAWAGGKFAGDIDAEAVAKWLPVVRELSAQASSTRVVGKFGVGYALARMSTDTVGAEAVSGDWSVSSAPWSAEHMYEILLTGPSLHELENAARRTGSKVWRIGRTVKGILKLDEQAWDLAALAKDYASGWSKHFAQLA